MRRSTVHVRYETVWFHQTRTVVERGFIVHLRHLIQRFACTSNYHFRSDYFSSGHLEVGISVQISPSDGGNITLHGKSNKHGCLNGAVVGMNREGTAVFTSQFHNGNISKGPRWFKIMSIYDNALVGTLYFEEGEEVDFKEAYSKSQPHSVRYASLY